MDGTVRLWSLESGAAQGTPLKAHVRGVVALAYDPLKHVLYSAGLDRHLHVWNPFLESPLCALKVAAYHPTLTLLTMPTSRRPSVCCRHSKYVTPCLLLRPLTIPLHAAGPCLPSGGGGEGGEAARLRGLRRLLPSLVPADVRVRPNLL
jgi:hypothetical protein